MSLRAGLSCAATAAMTAAPAKASTSACTRKIQPLFVAFIGPPWAFFAALRLLLRLAYLQFPRSGSIRLVMRDAKVAVDACEVLGFHLRVPRARLLRLLLGVHGVVVVAVAALERVGFLHARPDLGRELVALGLEFFLGVDVAHEMAPHLQARAHL